MILLSGKFYMLMYVVFTSSSSQKECYRIKSDGYERFCCDNYIRKNGECIECKPGTKSKNEKPCEPCKYGTFGKKCSLSCDCSNSDRCDRVFGCVHIQPLSTERGNAVTNGNFIQTDVNQNTFDKKEGITKREMYVYSAGFGGLLILIISVFLIYIYCSTHKSKQLQINQINEENDISVNAEILHESVYESIDESTMCDDNFQNRNSQEIFEEDNNLQSGSEVSSKSSGYLHPLTTFTENDRKNLYCKQSNSSSASSSPEYMKRDSGYTHPYQQMKKDIQTIPKSEYTELTIVHYLELVDVPIKTDSDSRNHFLNYTRIKQRSRESESRKDSDCSSSLLDIVRNSSLLKFYSVQHLHSSSKMNGLGVSINTTNKAVKYNSI